MKKIFYSIKHLFIYFTPIFLFISDVMATEYDVAWLKTYGTDHIDQARFIVPSKDGNYVHTGFITNAETHLEESYLMKIDQDGNQIWLKNYGDGIHHQRANMILPDSKGYLLVGYLRDDIYDDWDAWLVRVNQDGDTLWTKNFGGSGDDYTYSAASVGDSAYNITGSTYSLERSFDGWIFQVDTAGNLIWEKKYGGNYKDQFRWICRTTDGNYVLTGYSDSVDRNLWIQKIDVNGNIIWVNMYGGIGQREGTSVIQTQDEKYIVTGTVLNSGTFKTDIMILYVDINGAILDSSKFEGGKDDFAHRIFKTNDSEFIIAGNTKSPENEQRDCLIIKVNNRGEILWSKTVGGMGDDYAQSICQTPENNYLCCGVTTSIGEGNEDIFLFLLAKVDPIKANFSADVTKGVAPLTVNFKDLSSTADSTEINIQLWDFDNDGVIDGEGANPKWTYNEAGEYSVTLIVSNGILADTLTKSAYINVIQIQQEPLIYSIKDVPKDQGGWVLVNFSRSIFDDDTLVTDSTPLKIASPEIYTIEMYDEDMWIGATSTAAYGDKEYSVLVHTLRDYSQNDTSMIAFRVIAGMNEGNFVSQTYYGISRDNIAPSTVQIFSADQLPGGDIELKWKKPGDTDIECFKIYKKSGNSSEILVVHNDTTYIDKEPGTHDVSYYITSVDFAGNESERSEEIYLSLTGTEELPVFPLTNYLEQNYPNPFNPETKINFGIPFDGFVRIEIYNILGEYITTLVNGNLSAGRHELIWRGEDQDGNAVSSGIYFYSIRTVDYFNIKKMLLIR